MRDEKLHAVVARSTFGSQNVKNTRGSDHFWKLRCQKSARRCGARENERKKERKKERKTDRQTDRQKERKKERAHSQNVQNTPYSDHFWDLTCRKSARRCGAKHISKSKC